jgi:hypothetical protein
MWPKNSADGYRVDPLGAGGVHYRHLGGLAGLEFVVLAPEQEDGADRRYPGAS